MNLDRIEELIRLARESTAQEVAVESGNYRLLIRKQATGVSTAKASAGVASAKSAFPSAETNDGPDLEFIQAPMVGIFRFPQGTLNSGEMVNAGQVVGSIEVMKLANEIRSDWDGVIVRTLVEDGQPVEYGQVLFELKPQA